LSPADQVASITSISAALACEAKAELHDLVARLRQLTVAEPSRKRRNDLADFALPVRSRNVDGLYMSRSLPEFEK
jgi:hypothetical protein